jgi:hypothetical protein
MLEITMNVETFTAFFMWCSIISTGIYLVWVLFLLSMPDFVYGVQTRWLPVPRETWNTIMFSFMGAFKVILILFIIVPYVSLLILG